MKRLMAGLVFSIVALGGGLAARAGWRYTNDKVTVNLKERKAFGQIGAARNSADDVQYIGCYAIPDGEFSMGLLCQARNAKGVTGSCVTYGGNATKIGYQPKNPQFNKFLTIHWIALAINGDSYIHFEWDEQGFCKNLTVENMSWHAPKNP